MPLSDIPDILPHVHASTTILQRHDFLAFPQSHLVKRKDLKCTTTDAIYVHVTACKWRTGFNQQVAAVSGDDSEVYALPNPKARAFSPIRKRARLFYMSAAYSFSVVVLHSIPNSLSTTNIKVRQESTSTFAIHECS